MKLLLSALLHALIPTAIISSLIAIVYAADSIAEIFNDPLAGIFFIFYCGGTVAMALHGYDKAKRKKLKKLR